MLPAYIYFLGIGGIGMSALARWFNANGTKVVGYDKTPTDLTAQLQEEGIEIIFDDAVEALPKELLTLPKNDVLVVFTPAIPKIHRGMNFLREEGFTIKKRAEVLGIITSTSFTIGIAGTHGKTTTSSMLSHLLEANNRNCSAFLGGISTNYGTNMLLGDSKKDDHIVVVEADEFDRSFLQLSPNIIGVTSCEADHLDIYGDEEAVFSSFQEFINKLPENGKLYLENSISKLRGQNPSNSKKYGINKGDIYAENLRVENAKFYFDANFGDGRTILNIGLQMPGFHNVENALLAMSIALEVGLSEIEIKQAIESYKGVKRRFEKWVETKDKVYVDDYAHHPTEITTFIKSLKALYPKDKITVIFQPHLYSRTADFADEFGESLSLADEVWLLPLYPAREEFVEGVNSEMLLGKITHDNKRIVLDDDLINQVKRLDNRVVATVGAGNIDRFIKEIASIYS
ncbi:UDP-N-acetylmuramate--L-alanine ligase [Flammeovirga kamogawensis]|uniref:UDP-N-acetylmuramate--L-alanine ligase n=1 Tax=Flammeovirga kamogawensis TaxID=373891 RepID=A0ABX8H008_9BACT|nr:UDP-N-acetylmuramate--L-alanine ligase [Flammeovirga kamogawensis]MBB6459370.1 UDP-N-acetylmuramate--alanine ligase [Flammeovirga kamogawensis]QWG08927.1 UDP-N-acetylmuramate--L-alanine ligase [Flammeovirga kamogawensis]TRX67219.1 UDP-N-acetylmuramate--L-alanine ligase [Flammeovirga kamogawensis]